MNNNMTQYMNTFNNTNGSEIQKVKAVIMHHADAWELANDATLNDLLDDNTISADDIVDFLGATLDIDGGNTEFTSAVRALQICLRKARLAAIKPALEEENFEINDNTFENATENFRLDHLFH